MTALFTLLPEAVVTIQAESKAEILDRLAERFAAVYELDSAEVAQAIKSREALGSTGFGRGVAIPHARLDGLRRPVSAFLRLEAPVDFDAADAVPVEMAFGLLSPSSAGAAHLHALAAISRTMREERMYQALCGAPDAEALYGLLSNVIDRDAA